ncbi:MAG: glycoside hydrolase family 99-like domain-containing protein, partial [Thermoguttaceae bacterium]|nr:glycoside hydrolase family 99-like domain-containing protein [Thermoguttaceae bacterium]
MNFKTIAASLYALLALSVWASAADKYVPKPIPVKSDIEITALYYPGTEQMAEWYMVEQTLPQRKPLLGWYDEGSPEVIDWQIKWSVEHGISAYFVDWYWNMGEQRLDHWVKGFYKAKYRSYLKWAMMWANHNQPGAHSTQDFRNVVKFWLDNYFRTPEYYTIEGKPVVMIYQSDNIDRDMIAEAAMQGKTLKKGEGLKYAIDFCDKLVKEAGLKGIYFMDVYNHGEYKKEKFEELQAAGIRESCIYGFHHTAYRNHPNRAKLDRWNISFDIVLDTIEPYWQKRLDVYPNMPFMPHIPTGWNSIPRTFDKSFVIYDRTPEKFAKVCKMARDFCVKNGIKRVVLGPVNEWQEGSYIEPNEEYGFGMFDALRDAFCTKPAGGWPPNVTPKELGLGPYEFPPMPFYAKTKWTFDNSTEGWYRNPYGSPTVVARNGKLTFFRTQPKQAAIRTCITPFDAAKFKSFHVRMKLVLNAQTQPTGKECAKLYWGSKDSPVFDAKFVVNE